MESDLIEMRPAAKKKGPVSVVGRPLNEVRNALLHLHKTLVDSERIRYEKTVGPIQSPNQFLKLLTDDPWFAWLHPLSQLIVSMDEALEEREPLTQASVEALIDQSRRMLVASENNHAFAGHYFEALQHDPDVVLAHGEAVTLIRSWKKPG